MKACQLKFLAALKSGDALDAESIKETGTYPVYGGNGRRGFTETRTHSLVAPLIGRQGALCGNVNFASGDFYATEHAVVATPRVGVDARWLYWTLESLNLNQYSTSAAQPGLAVDTIARVQAPFATLPEQERIANFLDGQTARIDALIAEKERLLQLLAEQRLSVSERVLAPAGDGRLVKLGFFADLLPGFAFPSEEFSRDTDDVPLLRGVNVSPGVIRWDESVYWRRDYEPSLERFKVKDGDVILGMDRPWISSGARVAMVDATSEGALLLQRVCRLRGGEKFSQRFLYFALSSDSFRQSVEVELTGVSVPHISPEQILRFKVPAISTEEQVVRCSLADAELERLLTLDAHTSAMLNSLREYRSSLISAAVTGQLDINTYKQAA